MAEGIENGFRAKVGQKVQSFWLFRYVNKNNSRNRFYVNNLEFENIII